MDAHSVSFTNPAERHLSRIYQDLDACGLNRHVSIDQDQLRKSLMMASYEKRRTQDPSQPIHVAVIGGGVAGLRCADLLDQYGFKVTVIEGRNRLGGRMTQARLPNGRLVDLGPNWIHGTEDNPMKDIALETGTAVGTWDTRSHIYDESGQLSSIPQGEEFTGLVWKIVADAFAFSNMETSEIHPGRSLLDFFEGEVARRIPNTELDYETSRKMVLQIAELWGAFVGSPIHRQSLKFFWLEECIEGENLFCAGTYEKILQSIAKPVVEHAEIMYESVVTKIEYRTSDTEKVRVQVNNDQVLEFDEVVLTAPLGWLKRHQDAFAPPLPGRLTKAIDSIGYGCLEKVYISFPAAFWREPDENGRIVQGFCQWLAPMYAPDTNPQRWNQEVVELASLTDATSHPTLLFYTFGEQSMYLTARARELPQGPKRDEFFRRFFEPYYSRLPHYDASNPDCKPTGYVATDWLHDELAGNGSYSNFQVGLVEGDKDIRVMREGLPEAGLWLAGEHTAPFVGLGTATGAYWSGESVGRRIAEAYGKVDKEN